MASPLDLKTLEAAATWYVQLSASTPSESEHKAWRDWLGASPLHAQAWARVEKLQGQWARLPQDIALPTLVGVRARRRAVLKTLGLLLAAGASGWLVNEQVPYQVLLAEQRTRTGQRRSLRLADGSQLDLNTDTAVDIRFDNQVRLIRLHRGEVLIQTASDPARRPFIVQTEQGSVRALGTRFSVRDDRGYSTVGVLEEAVELRPLLYPERLQRLEAGQQARLERARVGPLMALPAGAGAWTQGMLTVIDWRLADFIAELGRYRPGVLRCAPAVADLRLSGAFRLDDSDIILENLGKSLPVKVRYLTRYWASVEPA